MSLSSDNSGSADAGPLPLVGSEDTTLGPVISEAILEEDGDTLEEESRPRLIAKILELEEKTADLGMKTADILKDNAKLRSGNEVLTQYIENLLASSALFQRLAATDSATGQPRPLSASGQPRPKP